MGGMIDRKPKTAAEIAAMPNKAERKAELLLIKPRARTDEQKRELARLQSTLSAAKYSAKQTQKRKLARLVEKDARRMAFDNNNGMEPRKHLDMEVYSTPRK